MQPSPLSLRLPSERRFLPLAVAMAENAGHAYGFGSRELYCLTLGAEDIFSYLCRGIGAAQPIEIDVAHQTYCLVLRFFCPSGPLHLRLLNVTAKPPIERGEVTDDFELFAVSRMVDTLRVTREPDGRICLAIVVDRVYDEETRPDPGEAGPARIWKIRAASAAELPCFAARTAAHYPESQYPEFLRYPGKAVDVIATGDWKAAVAVDEQGALLGGALWSSLSPQTLEMSGPFLFPPTQTAELGAALVEYVLEATARTDALGILGRCYDDQPIPAGFELLGTIRTGAAGSREAEVMPIYRQLHEDSGAVVYGHPLIADFLRQEFTRLVLPRELRVTPAITTVTEDATVLTCDYRKASSQAVLRILRYGTDAVETLQDHLALFRKQGLQTILLELDLGAPWQSALTPALLETGFLPRMIVPYAGRADTVIFQHSDQDASWT